MGRYFKSKEARYQAFYACILNLWDRKKAGKEINPSVMIDRFHLGHIKIEPYLRLANQEERPTYEQCCKVRDELSQHQKQMNQRRKKEKKEKANFDEDKLFNSDLLDTNLAKALRETPEGEIIAARFLLECGWILKRPVTSYEDYV